MSDEEAEERSDGAAAWSALSGQEQVLDRLFRTLRSFGGRPTRPDLLLGGVDARLLRGMSPREREIAELAFRAAVGARSRDRGGPDFDFDLQNDALGPEDLEAGIVAAAWALRRIPRSLRSDGLNAILDACGCSPNPVLP